MGECRISSSRKRGEAFLSQATVALFQTSGYLLGSRAALLLPPPRSRRFSALSPPRVCFTEFKQCRDDCIGGRYSSLPAWETARLAPLSVRSRERRRQACLPLPPDCPECTGWLPVLPLQGLPPLSFGGGRPRPLLTHESVARELFSLGTAADLFEALLGKF